MKKRDLLAAILAGTLLLGLAACGSEDPNRVDQAAGQDGISEEAEPQEEMAEDEAAEEPAEEADGAVYVATEFAFDGPSTLPAGETELVLENEGDQKHEIAVIRLADGKTIEDVQRVLSKNPNSKPPKWVTMVGAAFAPPGQTDTLQTNLEPGTHVFLCFVPDKESKKPHVALGMVREVTVE